MWEQLLKAKKLGQRFYILGIEFKLHDLYDAPTSWLLENKEMTNLGVKEFKQFKKTIEELYEEIQKKIPEIKITSVTSHPELYGKLTLSLNIESKYIKDIVLIFHPSEWLNSLLQPDIEVRVYYGGMIDDYNILPFTIKDDIIYWIKRKYDFIVSHPELYNKEGN
tara:strand:+ start:10 stop:504 length:495 start_codon:yes stop_codon:yes gene_type:complete